MPAAECYRWLTALVTPRPIAWVSTRSPDGVDNLAPFSFFQVVADAPPTLMIGIGGTPDGSEKDTLRNLRARGELVIHLVSNAMGPAMNATAARLPPQESEFEHAGLARLPSARVAPPRIAGAAVAFECALAELMPYPREAPASHVVFARVLLAHVDDAVLRDGRHVDPAKLDLIARLGGPLYTRTRDAFAMRRPE
ncbi:flavin reductase family protein [Tolypothrix campylonemoides VB511288]|nr:flavin reductase family protein [Tolypothrix campylonemoides VB511288]